MAGEDETPNIINLEDWNEHRRDLRELIRKTDAMQRSLIRILGNTEHLSKLEVITSVIVDMKSTLVEAAVGKDQMPMKTHNEMFSQLARMNSFNYKTFAAVICALLGIIVFLLTGEVSGWIKPLK